MGIIPKEIFELIKGPSPSEPGMHGKIVMEKPGGDFISQVTQIRDICDNIIEAYGDDQESDETKDKSDKNGKDDDNEFRKMRSKSQGQGEEEDGEQKLGESLRK